ncbi:MAG: hypothetical protein LBM04_04850 [Opitutaceae bacterium]|jgi:hypothetical protein|nr:hypothetical protein [Opitutaceae bacterium]
MSASADTPRKFPWLRWCAYIIAIAAFVIAIRRAPIRVIPLAIDPTPNRDMFTAPPEPAQCAFGHQTLARIPVVQGISEDEDPAEHRRKVDALEIWDVGPPGICGTLEGPAKLVCKTCRFAYDEALFSYTWKRSATRKTCATDQYLQFSEIILNTPLLPGISHHAIPFSQTANHGQLLEEECRYWTNEPYDKVIDTFTAYLSSRGIKAITQNRVEAARAFYWACAQVGSRYMKLEIKRESTDQIHITLKTVSYARALDDRTLRKALGLVTIKTSPENHDRELSDNQTPAL